ncbi:MAG: molybdopterin molybdotransferase MoeA [bacterium JZ-2024 1]
MKTSLTVLEAKEILRQYFPEGKKEKVALLLAKNRVLAETPVCPEDIPPFDNSALDGYAVAYNGIISEGTEFPVVGKVVPGDSEPSAVPTGCAVEISTGAPIPPSATTIIPVEQVEQIRGGIRLKKSFLPGENIRRKGEVLKAGDTLLTEGTLLTPPALGLLAMAGITSVQVWAYPSVSLATTGSELVDFTQPLNKGKIRDCNLPFLQFLLEQMGMAPRIVTRFRDIPEEATPVLERMKGESDVLILSGAVSVGSVDWVKKALHSLGFQPVFWRIKQRPGGPLFFATHPEKKWAFGLPGNPVSSAVAFYEYVYPFLRAFAHLHPFYLPSTLARAEENWTKKKGRYEFWAGVAKKEGKNFYVRSSGIQKSHYLNTLACANCLIYLPEEVEHVNKNELVEIHLLPDYFSLFLQDA